ncbi:hypothetical protein SAMN04488038_10284 [Solimonas aquatica]|uniref:DUF1302 domain-containing protein n=1 Tax=Solimonas aquatica TaxID=489703 RepID=A0A1H9BGA3_9GAMM|nr:DUF1302 family protein [Solimonas aquatica]SEP88022.1 hypothetical protein SAMN04488038_10284 [Solimonas aquatica]
MQKMSEVVLTVTLALASCAAQAGGGSGFELFGGDFSYNGLLRVETAISTSGEAAPANQYGDPANGVAIRRNAGNPVTGWQSTLTPQGLNDLLGALNLNLPTVAPNPLGVSDSVAGVADTVTRYVPARTPQLNYHILRFEATPSLSWGNISLVTRLRAIYDPGSLGYDDFDYRDYRGINGGITGGYPDTYHGKPSYYQYPVDGKKNPIFFELTGRNYMVDLPALILQWTNGQTTVRLGNQSVAWGQLLFFRVMDVANGLDLRRHLILDRGLEEYADERMSAPGLRITHQVNDEILADAYLQQFIPSVLPNPNTPYNVVASQFTIHDRYFANDNNKDVNYGIRLKADYGTYSMQAMYSRRYNQLGAIRWTKSGVNKPLPSSNTLGAVFNQYCNLTAPLHGYQSGNGCGPFLADTAFEASPAGVMSAEEWYNYAGYTKLDGIGGLNAAVDDFPAAQQLLAQSVGRDPDAANNELDAFFMAAEGLRGHIERTYHPENVFGIGGSYMTEAEPGSFFDQMIFNVEATLTKNRTFTAPDLRHSFIKRDDAQIGLVVEKYQRFSTEFPATYLVFQYLWQKESDLFGLMLDGYGSENFSDQGVVLNKNVPTKQNPRIVPGINGANYAVFAFLQPWPAYIWAVSGAALIDMQGGVLLQPSVQWKPRGDITVDLFYNYVDDSAWGNNANRNIMSFINFADEVGIRFGYQF